MGDRAIIALAPTYASTTHDLPNSSTTADLKNIVLPAKRTSITAHFRRGQKFGSRLTQKLTTWLRLNNDLRQ